jgi:hypothetical protein
MAEAAARLLTPSSRKCPCANASFGCPPLTPLGGRATQAIAPVLQTLHRATMRRGSAFLKFNEGDDGAVTLIQRPASAANRNLHGLVADGVFCSGTAAD